MPITRTPGRDARTGWGVTSTARDRNAATGAGHGIDADLVQAHESALKEAETDATRRALMTAGNPFGPALGSGGGHLHRRMGFRRISHDPAVMGGKPCIRGLGITVGTIVGLMASGSSPERRPLRSRISSGKHAPQGRRRWSAASGLPQVQLVLLTGR